MYTLFRNKIMKTKDMSTGQTNPTLTSIDSFPIMNFRLMTWCDDDGADVFVVTKESMDPSIHIIRASQDVIN